MLYFMFRDRLVTVFLLTWVSWKEQVERFKRRARYLGHRVQGRCSRPSGQNGQRILKERRELGPFLRLTEFHAVGYKLITASIRKDSPPPLPQYIVT